MHRRMTGNPSRRKSCVSEDRIHCVPTNKQVAKQKRWGIYVKQAKRFPLVRIVVVFIRFCVVGRGARAKLRAMPRVHGICRKRGAEDRKAALCSVCINGGRQVWQMPSLPPSANRTAAIDSSEATKRWPVVFEGRGWCSDWRHMFRSARRSVRGIKAVRVCHRC